MSQTFYSLVSGRRECIIVSIIHMLIFQKLIKSKNHIHRRRSDELRLNILSSCSVKPRDQQAKKPLNRKQQQPLEYYPGLTVITNDSIISQTKTMRGEEFKETTKYMRQKVGVCGDGFSPRRRGRRPPRRRRRRRAPTPRPAPPRPPSRRRRRASSPRGAPAAAGTAWGGA